MLLEANDNHSTSRLLSLGPVFAEGWVNECLFEVPTLRPAYIYLVQQFKGSQQPHSRYGGGLKGSIAECFGTTYTPGLHASPESNHPHS